ncbi:hypothetical protein [Thioalkalivibrio sp. ALMg3]|uniref:hypothetical protein n=1 Tax=Thioalkalivibrio sp. ALMg3 TaxID=1158163 RepID=UPI0012DBF0BE|nr:hypothetical protein [Thioalkalivibrio sp. ALMg3]
MARSPARNTQIYFLGAGFSKAFGLPNTAELLSRVHSLSNGNHHWGVSADIGNRLEAAYQYFYPDDGKNFQPPVGGFFTVLSTYESIGSGLPQGFSDSSLLRDLKFAIASIICSDSKQIDKELTCENPLLDDMLQPGHVVITSNWDYLIERACIRRGVPFRLQWANDLSALTILKLHGSVDWTEKKYAKKPWGLRNYFRLEDLINPRRQRHDSVSSKHLARSHAVENWTRGYQVIKGSTHQPFMLTMARAKSMSIGPVMAIWSDAYDVLSRADRLSIIGYSIPDDDVEIRTLLRAGLCRGTKNPTSVIVINPEPSVHERVRRQIYREVESDYSAVRGP